MTLLTELKDALQRFYIQNEYWATPLLRAVTAFLCFFTIDRQIGSGSILSNPLLELAAAALCSFLPWTAISVIAAVFVLGHAYETSLELALIAAFVLLFSALIQAAFRAGHAVLIALVPLFFYLHVPYVIPVAAGLSLGLSSIIPVSIGILMYYLLSCMNENAAVLSLNTKDLMETANQYAGVFQGLFENRTMLVTILAFAVCIVLVYILHQLELPYSWSLALLVGIASILIVSLFGVSYGGAEFSLSGLLVGAVLSACICFLYALIFHGADYRGTERLRFEDEDYFYFVKAVPKLKSGNEE